MTEIFLYVTYQYDEFSEIRDYFKDGIERISKRSMSS